MAVSVALLHTLITLPLLGLLVALATVQMWTHYRNSNERTGSSLELSRLMLPCRTDDCPMGLNLMPQQAVKCCLNHESASPQYPSLEIEAELKKGKKTEEVGERNE